MFSAKKSIRRSKYFLIIFFLFFYFNFFNVARGRYEVKCFAFHAPDFAIILRNGKPKIFGFQNVIERGIRKPLKVLTPL